MSHRTVRIAYLSAVSLAASRGCTVDHIREFGEHYVGLIASIRDIRDWPTTAGTFADWIRDAAFASLAA